MDSLKLKAIEICGFKSFADKTRLTFDKPVTVVVGPNGSGKSNISDAVLWVTGEQSSKALRGGKMEDVIFGGTEKRRQMGFAEVSLILDNEDGKLGIENAEVMITRRYFRSGESEYYINRAQCRLRDVNELLMDTGMGREGYSIIGQGKIDEILSARSTDRRSIFEEAAGISKFRHRKEESERKLQRTDDNLLRVNDKISELELQVEPLRRQAETARKYLVLRDELRDIEIAVWTEGLKRLASDRENYETLKRDNFMKLERAKAEMDEFFAKTDEYAQLMQDKDLYAETLREKLSENEERASTEESAAAVLRANLESTASEKSRIETEMSEQDDRDRGLCAQIEEKKQRIQDICEEEIRLAEDAAGLLASMGELSESTQEADRQAGDVLADEQRLLGLIQEKQTAVSALAAAAQELQDRDFAAQKEAQTAAERLAGLNEQAKTCRDELTEVTERITSLDNIIAGYRMRAESRRKKAEAANQAKQQLELDQKALESRITLLLDMEKDYTGYSRAVKTVMQEASRGLLKGVYGTVGSLLKTADAYTVAIETALAGNMQEIIVSDEECGKACINLLKRRDAGRGTFLPCSTMRGSRMDTSWLDGEAGFVGAAIDLISFDPKYSGVYTQLLGKTAVVEDMDIAIRISRRAAKKFRIVTLDGQVINASGSMSGGSAVKNAGILSRANELENLKDRRGNLAQEVKKATEAFTVYQSEYQDANNSLELSLEERQRLGETQVRLQADSSHFELLVQAAGEAAEAYRSDSQGLQERLKANTDEIKRLQEEASVCEIQLEEVRSKIVAFSEGKEQLLRCREEYHSRMQEIREKQASLSAEKTSQEGACAELESLRANLIGGRSRQNEYIRNLERREQQMQLQLSQSLERLQEIRDCGVTIRSSIEQVNREKLELEGKRNRHTKQMQERNEAVLRLEREDANLEQKLNLCTVEESQLVDKLWDTYELSRSRAMELAVPPENLGEAKKHAAELKRSMSRLGTPNLGAIEEFDRVNERYTFLTSQRDDIEKAKQELIGIISDITDEMKGIFAREFNIINEQFKKTFLELFGGGRANLELEDENDILSCGIEIKVQPPGKSLKTITLLSGGEKAFVAIALYFAVLKVRPAPFVIMDEIEAALDEANVSRVAGYLRQMSDKTQMIVISHRRGTMEEADVLYGVTMQEQGVSRVLTIDLDEAERTIVKE